MRSPRLCRICGVTETKPQRQRCRACERKDVPPCSLEGCDYPRYRVNTGYCRGHQKAYEATGDPLTRREYQRSQTGTCSAKGCDKPHRRNGYCINHSAQQARRRQAAAEGREVKPYDYRGGLCQLPGCLKKHHALGFCRNHYMMRRRMATTPARWGQQHPHRRPVTPIRELIHSSSLSHGEIAARSGVQRETIQQISTGRYPTVRDTTADAILTALGRHPDEVYGVAS